MTPERIVQASIARQSIDSPCHTACANGQLCQYHDGVWDGADEALRSVDDADTKRLRSEISLLGEELAETRDLYDIRRRAHNESDKRLKRAKALIAWIDGACTDQKPHAEIEAAITRYYQEANR